MIRDLWTQGTDSIHNINVVNTDTVSYQAQNPENCMDTADREKKKKHLHACLNERRHFAPLVASVNVLLGVEAEATLRRISIHLAQKWN